MNKSHALTKFMRTKGDEFVLEEIVEHDGGMGDYCITGVLLKHIPTGLEFRLKADFDMNCFDVGISVEYG